MSFTKKDGLSARGLPVCDLLLYKDALLASLGAEG